MNYLTALIWAGAAGSVSMVAYLFLPGTIKNKIKYFHESH